MKILVGISHPKHVYMFKNLIKIMEAKGHEFKVIMVEKEITGYLLEKFDIQYKLIGKNQPTLFKKMMSLPIWEYRTLKIATKFKPDIFIGQALPHFAHISTLLNKPFIVCEDTEIAKKLHRFVLPFADAIVTPNCYKDDLGKKHVRFKGFFELAYLHPKNFEPDISVLDDLGININDKYVVVRLVSWHAHHDIGYKGMSLEIKKKVIEELEKYAKIYISSESALPSEFKKYELKCSPVKMHNLLYYAALYVGDSGTMATEAGILGTPSIYISSLASAMGNFEEMEKKYGLMHSYSDPLMALYKALELIKNNNSKEDCKLKRLKLLEDSVDVNELLIDIIENINNS
ncbi:MAG: DUF354 domain-containing protein [Methanosarcinales archaeon]|nr:DUF354 domain-containing protein [Methanosarcinales archaeon]